MPGDDEFEVRLGRPRDSGVPAARRGRGLVAQVRMSAARQGFLPARQNRVGAAPSKGTGRLGRGQGAALSARSRIGGRRVVIKARTVRHFGERFRAAPLARHVAYLQREGVSRDGQPGTMFDARGDAADGEAFAERCEGDRHHFRFIVSPEDAAQLQDLRAFTRELMEDASRDLGTGLDWVATDHWNTDNPHVHVLVRGVADDGQDLVIDRDYIRAGFRERAEARATLELGPRSEQEVEASLDREVDADRWTSIDRGLRKLADENLGLVDLRPGATDPLPDRRDRLIGRAMKLEQLGLAEPAGPGCWTLKPDAEATLRDLSIRGDIIKTMHRAMSGGERAPDLASFAIHGDQVRDPVIGRLVERGLHDELAGTAYAVIDGVDGRTHHLRFDDLAMTGDARSGAIVELRQWRDRKGADRLSLTTRSDLTIAQQIEAGGATWLDRELVSRSPVASGGGFGLEVRDAMAARAERLTAMGLAERQGERVFFKSGMLETLRRRDLDQAVRAIAARTGLDHQPGKPGDPVAGLYRERVTLASGRFALIDNGLGFQLAPWRPVLDQQLGRHVSGVIAPGGGVDWAIGRSRGLGL